mmetsp:Transcript_13637/g.28548  ORF Transcript_13637/g.28548 Transcript_13637/m.28548 type:complete len:401 (-) Transcript_13637:743-1945(-)
MHILGAFGSLQRFQHDGHSVVVRLHVHLFHFGDGIPRVFKVAAVHSCIEDAVVGNIIWLEVCGRHLRQQVLGTFDVVIVAVSFQQGVVGDDIQQAKFLHLLNQLSGTVDIASFHANIQDTVEGNGIRLDIVLTEALDDTKCTVDITVTTSSLDEGHVVLDVEHGELLGELLGQGGPAAFHGELHQAAVHHLVRFQAVGADLVVQITGFAVHSAVGVDFHQATVDGDGHSSTGTTGTYETDDLLSEAQELALGTASQKTDTKAFADGVAFGLHLFEDLKCADITILCIGLQHGIIGMHVERHAGSTGMLFHFSGKLCIVTLHTFLEDHRDSFCAKRDALLQKLLVHCGSLPILSSHAQKLSHGKGRHDVPGFGHCDDAVEDLVHQAILQEALDDQRVATWR